MLNPKLNYVLKNTTADKNPSVFLLCIVEDRKKNHPKIIQFVSDWDKLLGDQT